MHLLPADLQQPQPATPGTPAGAEGWARPRVVQRRTPGLEYFVEHNGGQLYILSNAHGADNYAVYRWGRSELCTAFWACCLPACTSANNLQLSPNGQSAAAAHAPIACRVPAHAPNLGQQHWQAVVPEQAGTAIEDMDMVRDWMVLYQRCQGLQQVAALPLRHGLPAKASVATSGASAVEEEPRLRLQVAPLPPWALSVVAGANADYESPQLRLMLSSPVHPEASFDWHFGKQQLQARPQLAAAAAPLAAPPAGARRARGGQQPQEAGEGELAWQQLWAASHDGTAVPLTLAAHAAALAAPSPQPCLLVVYGAYGHCLPTEYAAQRIPLLRRGWVLALAHVRGGGELGRRWHTAGRGAAKANSAADLEACLDHLVAHGGWL